MMHYVNKERQSVLPVTLHWIQLFKQSLTFTVVLNYTAIAIVSIFNSRL